MKVFKVINGLLLYTKVDMVILHVQDYQPASAQRCQELKQCLVNNLANPLITKIILYRPSDYKHDVIATVTEKLDSNPKIEVVLLTHDRLTYADAFCNFKAGVYNILANSDIYFDETLSQLTAEAPDSYPRHNFLITLTRYELPDVQLYPEPKYSQDSWIIYGQITDSKLLQETEFPLGKVGCDNRLLAIFARYGYFPVNPCKTIKSYHLHAGHQVNYNTNNRLFGEYLFAPACHMGEIMAPETIIAYQNRTICGISIESGNNNANAKAKTLIASRFCLIYQRLGETFNFLPETDSSSDSNYSFQITITTN